MISRAGLTLALLGLLAIVPARGDDLPGLSGVVSVGDEALDALRGQALIQWRGIALRFSLERSAWRDGRQLTGVATDHLLAVQNSMDGRALELVTTFNATLNHAHWLRDQRMDSNVRAAAATALH